MLFFITLFILLRATHPNSFSDIRILQNSRLKLDQSFYGHMYMFWGHTAKPIFFDIHDPATLSRFRHAPQFPLFGPPSGKRSL